MASGNGVLLRQVVSMVLRTKFPGIGFAVEVAYQPDPMVFLIRVVVLSDKAHQYVGMTQLFPAEDDPWGFTLDPGVDASIRLLR